MNKINISMRVLSARIRSYGAVPAVLDTYINDRDLERINDVKIFNPQDNNYDDHVLYICNQSDILGKNPADLPANLFCYAPNGWPDLDADAFRNIIISNAKYTPEQITDCALNLEQVINRHIYSSDILEALYAGTNEAICRVGSDLSGNPVVLLSNDDHVIASCNMDTDNVKILELTDTGSQYYESKSFNLTDSSKKDAVKTLPDSDIRYCSYTVTASDLIIATLIILEDKVKIQPMDQAILENLGRAYKIMQFGTGNQSNSARLVYEYSFLRLLTDPITPSSSLTENRFEIIGYRYKNYLRVAVVDSIEKIEITDVKNYVNSTAEQLRHIVGRDGLCTPVKDYVAVLINVDSEEEDRTVLNKIKKFCVMNKLRAGISMQFNDGLDMRKCHRQALDALAMGAMVTPSDNMAYFDKLRIYRMISGSRRNMEYSELVPECLRKLIMYDRENNTTFVETLEYYIFAVKNSKKAAEMLHIHRNTLLYRLDKIYEIMGEDLEDGNLFIELGIAYKALEYMAAHEGRKLCFTPIHTEEEE
ncbi:MAG: helix-turn-helix domain-containing protein [Lachnospiraceae bacterium]|nr:helix-turn-helix domain-containing protein [Lachnospiraceae bacterium]